MNYMPLLSAVTLALTCQAAHAETVIRFAHMNGPTHFVHTEALALSERLKERTGGELRFEVFPSGQLGESAQIVEQMSFGSNIMGQVQAGNLADYSPDYSILVHPFMYQGVDDVNRLVNSDLVAELNKELLQKNLTVMCFLHYGTRDLYTRQKEVRTPEDSMGMSIRVQPVTIYTQMVERVMGGSPTPIPWPEVYSALAQGVIDAAEAPPLSIIDQRHYEHAKYLIKTNHIQDVVPLVMSTSQFNNLSAEHQEILKLETSAACNEMSKASVSSYEGGIETLREQGMIIIDDVDRDGFAKRASAISAAFPEWSPGLYERARAIIDAE